MADNILPDTYQSETAKRPRLDSDHAGLSQGCSSPPCPLGGAVSPQEEDSSSVPQIYSLGTHWLSNHDKVLEALNRLRLSGTLCDVTLCCEGQEFLCHRAVLASLSSYFEAMFTSGSKESTQDRVTITGVDPQVMGLLVDYAYTSTVSTSNVDVQALLAASDLLEFTAVSDNMKRYMDANNCGGAGVPTMKFVLPSHPEKVLEGLDRLRLNDTLCDVTLCCEGQEFPCHRSVLASFSSYFEAMFTSGMKESTQDRVTIGGVEPQVMDVLLDYAYTCEVSIITTITKTGVKHSNVKALLAASDLFDVTAVRELCCKNMEADVDIKKIYSLGTHWLSNHDKVLEALNRLRLSGTLCDVTLCCEGQEFLCHRAVLASLSSYFEAMFTSGSKESTQDRVTITGVGPQVMGLLVDYAYTSTVSTSNVDVQVLLAASDLLEFTAVSDNMKRYMDATNCGGAGVPTMKFVLPSHPEKVLEGLDRLRLNDTLCDVTLCCEGQEFPCHRSVLASFSSYFEAMFTSGMKESTQDRVTIGGVEPQIMDVLLDYAYTCEVSIITTITKTGVKHSNVKALLAASDLFDVTAVRELCCENMEAAVDIKKIYSLGTHWLSNHDKVLEALNRLRLSGTLCDVTLCCEGQEFLCHRAVLASLSSYFEAMFTSGSKESTQDRVTITGVDPQVMGLLVDYAYTSTVSTSNVDVQTLLAASDLLEFTAVSDNMKRYMGATNCGGAGVPTMKFVLPSHPEKVLEGLDRLRLNDTLCDVTLCCEGQEFPCHRSVLASFSSYFEAMFTSGMKESTQDRVTIRGVEPQVMDVLLDYAYTCEVSITTTITKTGVKHSNVKALLAASDLFDVTAVRELCCENMLAAVDLKNCVETYCFAEAHSCESLKKRSMDLILEDFRVLYQQEEFLSLPMERVSEILSSDHLNVPNEDTVLHAAMHWLTKNPTSPTLNFKKVFEFMQQVRLPLVTPSLLPGVMKCLAVLEDHEGCQGLLSRCPTRPRRRTVIVTVGAKRPGGGAELESFDPLTKEWKTVGQLPLELYNPNLLASGSTLYLAGEYGRSGPNRPWAMWRYDPPHSSWLKMSHTKEKRAQSRLVVLDGWLFAVGGRKYEKSGDSMERYDSETDTWHLMESVGMEERYSLSGLVVGLDRHLYFIGCALHGWYASQVQMAKYNPKTSVWTQLAPMQIPRDMAAACVLNGKIYVTGGHWTHEHDELLKQAEDSVECYNPQTDQWSMCAPMGAKRYGHSMAVVDGKMYVLGGMDLDFVQDDGVGYHHDIECYCEETDTWETVGELPAARYGLRCASLKLRNDHGQPIDDDDESEDDSTDEEDDDDWRSPNPSYLYSNSHRHTCSEDDREDLMFLRNFF